jgi:hypothetical protein
MTFLGGLLVLGAAYLIGRDVGAYGFFLSWFLIAACAMAGMITCLLLSLPALARKTDEDVGFDDDTSDGEVESFLKGHIGRWGWSGAFIGGVIGALLATVVI